MAVQLETLRTFDDARGSAFEPVEAAVLQSARNVHVVITEPGRVRGNHVHHRGTETLIIRGPARLALEEQGERSVHDVPPGLVLRVTLPAGVAHAVQNTGNQPLVLVSFGTEPFDPANTSPHPLLG